MQILKDLKEQNIIFLDIETASITPELEIDTPMYNAWSYLMRNEAKEGTFDEFAKLYKDRAGLYAEFARVVCITVGRIKGDVISLKTYNHVDEAELLEQFHSDLEKVTDIYPKSILFGHAIKGFDMPFILKRSLINEVEPHSIFDVSGKKPWEIMDIDTKDLWRNAPLITVAFALGIPSPKDDINGSQVGEVYWSGEANAVERISHYCERDVFALANVYRRCIGKSVLPFEEPKKVRAKKKEAVTEVEPLLTRLFNGGKFGDSEKELLMLEIGKMNANEANKAFEILDSLCSTAKGKATKITKADIKKMRLEYGK